MTVKLGYRLRSIPDAENNPHIKKPLHDGEILSACSGFHYFYPIFDRMPVD